MQTKFIYNAVKDVYYNNSFACCVESTTAPATFTTAPESTVSTAATTTGTTPEVSTATSETSVSYTHLTLPTILRV